MTGSKVLAVVSEIYPLVKTGGLADVAGALPPALRPHGVAVMTLVPGYPAVTAALGPTDAVLAIADLFGARPAVLTAKAQGLDLLVLDAPHLFARAGTPYAGRTAATGRTTPFASARWDWPPPCIGLGEIAAYVPDVIHGHDWQSGLAMAYLAYDGRPRPKTVLTVHNLAFQGQFPPDLLDALRLPPSAYAPDGVEYYGTIGFLKAGLQFADRITTVSPTYAAEIQTPPGGCGIDGLLRARAGVLSGILNGIDVDVWNPATDPRIPSRFDKTSLPARAPNKAAAATLALARRRPPAVRRREQIGVAKGLDLLADAVPALLDSGGQLAVLGTGDRELEQRWSSLAPPTPAASDASSATTRTWLTSSRPVPTVLVPSRFEPCGLTQLCALRYGAVPVVAKVGGLADTIVDVGRTAGGQRRDRTAVQPGHA